MSEEGKDLTPLGSTAEFYMDEHDIERLCAAVYRFSKKADLRFKALPIITWEFADLVDFARTRALLYGVMDRLTQFQQLHRGGDAAPSFSRAVSSDILEIDAHGVTFRLICHARVANGQGQPLGPTEINYE